MTLLNDKIKEILVIHSHTKIVSSSYDEYTLNLEIFYENIFFYCYNTKITTLHTKKITVTGISWTIITNHENI